MQFLYVPKSELLKVAKCILKAQDIKEKSWDATKTKYLKNDISSAKEICQIYELSDFWIDVIHTWMVVRWNDCQTWAEEIVNHKKNNK